MHSILEITKEWQRRHHSIWQISYLQNSKAIAFEEIKKSYENDIPNIPNYLHISDPNKKIWISSHRHQFHHKISLALWDQSLPTTFGGLFCSTEKMHISEYVCKTCLKKLRILLKCRETFEKFLATWSSSKNTGLPKTSFSGF